MKRIILILCLMLPAAMIAQATEQVSKPMEYSGYSKKEYKDFKMISQYVPMSDGVKLAVDVYLPRKGPKRDRFPVVVEYTPYSRAFINPALAPLDKTGGKNMMGGKGAVIPNPFCFSKKLVEHGYAVVIADIRGSGASFGSRFDLMPRIGDDGADLINWIAAQDWSDGNIGMKGASYMAMSQILTAARKPESLKALFLMIYPFGYHDLYVGGIYNHGFMTSYSDLLWTMNMNMSSMDGLFPVMPSAPVVDEDGDGEMLDEIPIDKNGDGSFTDDYNYPDDPNDPPQYADGSPREHLYYLATRDHLKNALLHDWMSRATFMDTTSAELGLADVYGNYSGYDISPVSLVPDIMETGIPLYHVGGWFDAQPRSTTVFYSTARETNPSKLLMIPGYHILTSPFYEYFGDRPKKVLDGVGVEQLRFFDRWLKGIQNGIDTEPPVMLYVMGKGFRQENEWPPARAKETPFYFADGGALDAQPGPGGADKYTADLSHDSRFGNARGNRWLMYVIPEHVPDRAELDKKCLTYTTAPLDADMEVTGHPVLEFTATSTADYGDFFAYLEDVTPEGNAVLVTEQPMRAGFAAQKDIDNLILKGAAGVDVKPDLPWHGYDKADYQDAIFAGGNAVTLKFDLQPTSWVFKKGHRIRISLAAADWPTFSLHPKLSPANDPDDPANVVPEITILRGADHPSRIVLPVVAD